MNPFDLFKEHRELIMESGKWKIESGLGKLHVGGN